MGSIYKKGRDGYYYYQTYVFNSKTGKNDKRKYYSLGTKDYEAAKLKKIELDKKHIGNNERYNKKTTYKFKFINKKTTYFIIIILLMFIANKIKNSFFFDSNYLIFDESANNTDYNYFFNDEIIFNEKQKKIAVNDISAQNLPGIVATNDYNVIQTDYFVVRKEILSESFNQIKIYITIDKRMSSDDMKLICVELKEIYKEFENIIICLFSNDEIGTELATGIKANIFSDEYGKYWLAMYSYNYVEGEYFDDNPDKYLQTY